MSEDKLIRINVPILARVEGEGALALTIRDGRIETLHLRIFEPPRLFEKFLEGRAWHEVPDIVARICGICPVAYQMSAVHALERIFGCDPGPWVRDMRRLLYCGEWIESHCLHIHLLAAPDFLGYGSAPEMAKDHPEAVRRGLRLQGLGNALIKLLGGRSVHPVGARVGGFHHAPSPRDVEDLLARLRAALPEAEDMVQWTASLTAKEDRSAPFTYVALRHGTEYPMNEGRIVSNAGLDITADQFDAHIKETHVPHSTALHAHLDGQPYLVGPLARLNLNHDRLPESVRALIGQTGLSLPTADMFQSIVARAIEVCLALREAIHILENYHVPSTPFVEVNPRAGIGMAATEAPRGILWHRYQTDDQGLIEKAVIVPPTSQNQARIEADLKHSLEDLGLERGDDALRRHGEQIIRNYDPCISCATHFLKIRVKRR